MYIIVKLRECSGKGILCQTGKASELHTRVEANLLYLHISYPVAADLCREGEKEEEEETRGECLQVMSLCPGHPGQHAECLF